VNDLYLYVNKALCYSNRKIAVCLCACGYPHTCPRVHFHWNRTTKHSNCP